MAAIGSSKADDCPHQKLLVRDTPARHSGMATAKPAGTFCIPIPIANAIDPDSVAAGNPTAAAPKATPTARPSGKGRDWPIGHAPATM
jgi:hypothetical protein